MGLSTNAKLYLEAFNSGPKFQSLTADQVREMMSLVPVPEGIEVPPVAKVENRQIAVNDGEISVRIYTPSGQGPFPLFLYYHGGGWVMGIWKQPMQAVVYWQRRRVASLCRQTIA